MPVVTASRTYFPGDLIYSEEPFVQVLPRLLKNEFCESCHCRSFNLRACKQCLAVKYCGKSCQKKNWSIHRLECKYMKNLDEEKSDDIVRLIGRVILKIKDEDWKSFKTSVLGTEVSFDDIDTHYKEMTENPHLNLMYKEMKERMREYIGVENMPSDIDFVKITGKVIRNTFVNAEDHLPGICFFIGLFNFEHECIPNSSFIVSQRNLKVWANKKIHKESGKITVSFRRLFESNPGICEEIDALKCKCSDCSLPYGESVLSKIMDDKKAYSLIVATQNLLQIGGVLGTLEMGFHMKIMVEELLKKHIGILGRTNILHLKLLGVRCLEIGGHAREVKTALLELESIMSSVFGEYYIEMVRIYKALALVHTSLGNASQGRQYIHKLEKMIRLK